MLSLNYTGLIALMIEAMKAQQAVIDSQQNLLERQNEKIEALAPRITELESE